MQNDTLWLETLQAFRDHGPLTAKDAFDHVRAATERKQVVSLVGKFHRRNGYLDAEDRGSAPKQYRLTYAGLAKLERMLASQQPDPVKASEQKLVKKIAELEPVQPWEFDPETDGVVRSLAALRFSPDQALYREGRERAGRLRYLAERLERVATVEALDVAEDLRETAGMLDRLTEVVS